MEEYPASASANRSTPGTPTKANAFGQTVSDGGEDGSHHNGRLSRDVSLGTPKKRGPLSQLAWAANDGLTETEVEPETETETEGEEERTHIDVV